MHWLTVTLILVLTMFLTLKLIPSQRWLRMFLLHCCSVHTMMCDALFTLAAASTPATRARAICCATCSRGPR